MKAQTTLEFIILLAAIAAFSTVLLGIYANFTHGQKSLLGSMGNSINAEAENANQSNAWPEAPFFIEALMQNITYVGIGSTLQGVLYVPGNASVSLLKLNASGAAVEPQEYSNIGNGTAVLPFRVIPLKAGMLSFNLTAIVNYSGNYVMESAHAVSYAEMPAAQNSTG
ncbi:MAG: hypothetical protein QXR73_03770, partial [Candidatus Micrarchaeaceae archaeon]